MLLKALFGFRYQQRSGGMCIMLDGYYISPYRVSKIENDVE